VKCVWTFVLLGMVVMGVGVVCCFEEGGKGH